MAVSNKNASLLLINDNEEEHSISQDLIIKNKSNDEATRKLWITFGFCFVFMIGEVVGGVISNSLAILTDAAHLLSDLAGFLISIFAIYISSTPATQKMSFGWHRAEILGAMLSVFMVWIVTGILVYEAILRVINPTDVDGKIMFIVACGGVFCNVIMAFTLGHGHSHGGGGGHTHGHEHHAHSHSVGHEHDHDEEYDHDHEHHDHDEHDHDHSAHEEAENINVRAAFIHVLGDLIQSIGVCIAGALIWYNPEWRLADPIATFVFSILVMATTYQLMVESVNVLMEGTPEGLDLDKLTSDLKKLDGVFEVHDLHVWSMSVGKLALSVHLVHKNSVSVKHSTSSKTSKDPNSLLASCQKMLRSKYGISHTTIQIELETDYNLLCDEHFH